MTDLEIQQRFIFLRAEGWTFSRIGEDLNVSKPTLINWSRKFQFEIKNQRAINVESLREKWLARLDHRVNAIGEYMQKIDAELAKRDVSTLSTSQLFNLSAALRRQIKEEIGPMQFSVPASEIPANEYHDQIQEWAP